MLGVRYRVDIDQMCLVLRVGVVIVFMFFFFFQAEDGIRDLVRSRGLGDVYKRQTTSSATANSQRASESGASFALTAMTTVTGSMSGVCLLYTSDAADERSSVDLGGRRIIKKKKRNQEVEHI